MPNINLKPRKNYQYSFQYVIMISVKCKTEEETMIYGKKCYKDLNVKLK